MWCSNCYRVGGSCVRHRVLFRAGWKHILYTWLWECQSWRWVRLSDWVKEKHCCKSRMEMYFYLFLWFFIFYYVLRIFLFFILLLYYLLYVFRITKRWWLPWVAVVGLVGESVRAPIGEAPQTFGERWGSVGRIMPREWSVTLRVCGVWVGKWCRSP